MDEDLIRFILAGAAEKHQLPLAIVDAEVRYDPFNPRQHASLFCRHLRGSPREAIPGFPGADKRCKDWDNEIVAEFLTHPAPVMGEPQCKECWLGLNDYITVLLVGNHRFTLFTGQMLSIHDPEAAAQRIRENVLTTLPTLARDRQPSGTDMEALLDCLARQPSATDEVMIRVRECVRDVQQQFERHWEMQRDALEQRIYSDLVQELETITVQENQDHYHDLDWRAVDGVLADICQRLGCNAATLFVTESHRGWPNHTMSSVLQARSSHGVPHELPHFNWTKSRIAQWDGKCIVDKQIIASVAERGLRGNLHGQLPRLDLIYASGDKDPGCRVVLVMGGFSEPAMATARVEFLGRLFSTLARRVHGLQLSVEIHDSESRNRELAEFLAHQVRSRLQTLYGFESRAQKFARGETTSEQLRTSSARFDEAMTDLKRLTEVVYVEKPTLYDPTTMRVGTESVEALLEAAVENQREYADYREVEIRIQVYSPVTIAVDRFWCRIMLNHLLHNAIKYSRPARDGRLRWIKVEAERSGDQIRIFIEDFGLGIKAEDQKLLFRPHSGVSEMGSFKRYAGSKRGLHEALSIAVAHGGTIEVSSRHWTGSEVSQEIIDECITTFTVVIPIDSQIRRLNLMDLRRR